MTEFPAKSVLPSDAEPVTSDERSGDFQIVRVVAVAVDDPTLSSNASRILGEAGHVVAGADSLEQASTVITVLDGNAKRALESIRARARPGAAIVALVRDPRYVQGADIHRVGAVAFVRIPIVAEELVLAVAAAEQGHERERQVAALSRQLDLQSHLASLGRVTAGISHEIANPLSAAMLNIETLQEHAAFFRDATNLLRCIAADASSPHRAAAQRVVEDIDSLDDCATTVRDIDRECTRIGALIGVMNELAARRPRTLEPVALDEIVHRVLALVPVELTRSIDVQLAVDDKIRVRASRLLIEQTAVNLVVNAAHALEGLPSPKIRLHVYSAGKEGILSVRDNGPGIAADVQARIFEPFYTTRRARGGTGLGLALCREYARQMGGRLSLWSVPGRGACFRIHLVKVTDARNEDVT